MNETPDQPNLSSDASRQAFGESLDRALRYVAQWRRKRVVVKFGGRALAKNDIGTLVEDLVLLQQSGLRPVLVHGGGPEISGMLERLQIEPRFIDGLRVTDEETMRIVEMVLAGSVNKKIVSMIQGCGGRAVGLSGKDAGTIRAAAHPQSDVLGYVGVVEKVDVELLDVLVNNNYIPVLASVGMGDDGAAYNLNADTAAAAVAVALGAEKLIILTDVPGIHQRTADGHERVPFLTPSGVDQLIADGTIAEGMLPKVEACVTAVRKGVPSAHIIAASERHAVLMELFTEAGIGTMIRWDTA